MSRLTTVMLLGACALLILLPSTALAWTPGTHVFLGEALLRSLHLLPPALGELLRAFPYEFLYGSIAADTSIAKKYAAAGRHCHSWMVGFEILDRARDEPLRAFSFGYLAHLAADVVAHNYFVPRQLAVTSSTAALGHSYWENRFETHLGERSARRARELILLDHSRSDGHLDRILSPTIFSTPTNRRIFRGMVRVTDMESWQRIFQLASEHSRWDLPNDQVGIYLARSFDYVVDLLNRRDAAEPYAFDPSGDLRLRLAKRVRREALRLGGEDRLLEDADRHFGMPASTLAHAAALATPLFGEGAPEQSLREDTSPAPAPAGG
ncbi:MAG: zinc dependent phospholipase C family protein [Gemmatimonadaceae bacterium]|nr:zinc dependent phospholipase C family protein [Gemmatimonadaceae bacterium]